MNKLRKAILLATAGSALAVASTHASATTTTLLSTSSNIQGAQSWNGANNENGPGHEGWAHTSDWLSFQATGNGTIDVKMTGSVNSVQPAFTVWNSGNTQFFWGHGHTYSQISSGVQGSFVGFSNNGDLSYFGAGPQDLAHGGNNAIASAIASQGTDGSGNKYAELVFSNLTAGTWYTIAAGGSGGTASGYSIIATLTPAAPVPVPAAAWLFGGALVSLGRFGKRKLAA